MGPVKRLLAVDGGGSKTDVLLLTTEGEPLAHARGPGSSPHLLGRERALGVLSDLVAQVGSAVGSTTRVAEYAGVYLSGADLPVEISGLRAAIKGFDWAPSVVVENDTFALLRAGTRKPDAVAVVCGNGINCVGVSSTGRSTRFPSLGRLSGDWGGGGELGEEVLWFAARAEDGRGESTALVDVVIRRFGRSPSEVGEAVHLGEIPRAQLGELTPSLFEVAEAGDRVAIALVSRLAAEVSALATAALSRLELLETPADVVLGGGVLTGRSRATGALSSSLLHHGITSRILAAAPLAEVIVSEAPPVVGAALLAMEALAGEVSDETEERVRSRAAALLS